MRLGQPTGLQIAFLSFAVMLVAAPISTFLVHIGDLDGIARLVIEKGGHFLLACILMLLIPPVRRLVVEMVKVPIGPSMRMEVAAVTLLKLAAGFGGMAAIALWLLVHEGSSWETRLARDVDRYVADAYSARGLVFLLLSTTVGPVVEEIVFRGFLYRAFERQWGWVASLIATSALFGIYHPHFWSAFTGSVVLVCLLRRTGSLRACIVVHMIFNLLLWPPLLGQHVIPRAASLTEPAAWVLHGICLTVAMIAVPAYVYMSRDRVAAPTVFLEPDGALQK